MSYDPSRRVREAPTDTGKARHRGLSTAHKTVSSVRPIAALAPPSDARQDRMMRGLLSRVLGTGQARSGVRPSSTAILLSGDETLEVVGESHRQEELWRIVGSRQEDYVRFDVVAVAHAGSGQPVRPQCDRGSDRRHPCRIPIARRRGPLLLWTPPDHANQWRSVRRPPRCDLWRRLGARTRASGSSASSWITIRPTSGCQAHHISTGHLRTGLSEAIATDLEDGSYDLSWLKSLSIDDEAAVQQLQDLLEGEDAPIDRHYMFCELEHRALPVAALDTHPRPLRRNLRAASHRNADDTLGARREVWRSTRDRTLSTGRYPMSEAESLGARTKLGGTRSRRLRRSVRAARGSG